MYTTLIHFRGQQTNMYSELDFRSTWQSLRAVHTGLPEELRSPQIDALHYLSERKHVILCVGTGGCHLKLHIAQAWF